MLCIISSKPKTYDTFNAPPTRPHKVDDRLVDTKRSTPKEFAGIPDMDCRFVWFWFWFWFWFCYFHSQSHSLRSKKLYVCGARSYGQEAGGHSGLTDDVSLTNITEIFFSLFSRIILRYINDDLQVTDNDLETYFNQYGTCTSIDQKVF